MPENSLGGCTCPEPPQLDVLHVDLDGFASSPQVGVPLRTTWEGLVAYLSRPTTGDRKDIAGAWSPALYRDGIRRKSSLVHACALVIDVDEGGDVDRAAEALALYRAIIHSTFSSTDAQPRCRIVLALTEWIDAPTYELTHAIIRPHLCAVGFGADAGAKDASRLSFAPVIRPGATYRFRTTDGAPLDPAAVLAAQPPTPARPVARVRPPDHRDRYIGGALANAADAVSTASEGMRHYTLSREAFGLARLGLAASEVEAALLPAFVAAAGERRQAEGVRTIRDAIRARQGGG
ncbi:MAG TPA: hypothetical protein VEK07_12995 [Polyangiaceae bacterium]|nr:hypothetical protein [Polyangiaceae bacterium]